MEGLKRRRAENAKLVNFWTLDVVSELKGKRSDFVIRACQTFVVWSLSFCDRY